MSANKRDYYEVLNVRRNAGDDDIKKAYRQCALAFHPDRNPGDKKSEEKFKEATEAYQVLADPEKRRRYDAYGHAGVDVSGFGESPFSASGFGDIFEDIFEGFFGGGASRSSGRARRGDDLEYTLEISFEQSAFGVTKEVELNREESCASCKGDGAKPGTGRSACPACGGRGQVLASSGFFSISRTCGRCHGEGTLLAHPCAACRGSGRAEVTRKIEVKVPAGVENGMRLRLNGEGEAGLRGGPRGDLYVLVGVRTHEFFIRDGQELRCAVPIRFIQAALGAEIEVPTLAGPAMLKIPPGTQGGREFRLKGKGFPSVRDGRLGDEVVRVLVETPAHLSERQKELLRQFESLSDEKEYPLVRTFIEKAKSLFS